RCHVGGDARIGAECASRYDTDLAGGIAREAHGIAVVVHGRGPRAGARHESRQCNASQDGSPQHLALLHPSALRGNRMAVTTAGYREPVNFAAPPIGVCPRVTRSRSASDAAVVAGLPNRFLRNRKNGNAPALWLVGQINAHGGSALPLPLPE